MRKVFEEAIEWKTAVKYQGNDHTKTRPSEITSKGSC
jgi:hypothetical protein